MGTDIILDPKKFIGRINRNIRFSQNKTPYKIRTYASIIKGNKTNPLPVLAFQMGSRDLVIMSVFYRPSKEQLKAIRENVETWKEFKELYINPDFVNKYGTIKIDPMKGIPSEYKECFKVGPLVANKEFYAVKEFAPNILLTDDHLILNY